MALHDMDVDELSPASSSVSTTVEVKKKKVKKSKKIEEIDEKDGAAKKKEDSEEAGEKKKKKRKREEDNESGAEKKKKRKKETTGEADIKEIPESSSSKPTVCAESKPDSTAENIIVKKSAEETSSSSVANSNLAAPRTSVAPSSSSNFKGKGKGEGKGKGKGKGKSSFSKGAGSNDSSDTAIKKNFYEEHQTVQKLTDAEVKAFRQEKNIRIISGESHCPKPIRGFEEILLPDYVDDTIRKLGFVSPSPIQCQGWPVALSGRDMIGIAETGSGKTLAFLLPAIIHINAQAYLARGESGPICLVLAPTRELACQIEEEARKVGGSQIRCTSLVGGTSKGPQIRDLKQGVEIVVATPGRLLDLLQMGVGFSLKRVSYLCLDEADRMLDMGFEKDLRKICEQIRPDRQTLLWSATWPKEVQKLARDLCKEDPVHIHVGEGVIGELKANPRVTQNVAVYQQRDDDAKMKRVHEILDEAKAKMVQSESKDFVMKTVVFAMTKRGCDNLSWKLEKFGALTIHGDKTQYERDWALAEFKKSDSGYDILVATDVAARGLDIKNVRCVINYDFPLNIEDYVHRIGRTGRAGTHGMSYSFFVSNDLKNARKSAFDLIKILRKANQEVPHELQGIANSGGGKGKGKGGKSWGRRW